jgi:hypothetical protein
MKCPYRKNIIHAPKRTEGYYEKFPKDIEEFPDCYKEECPLYIDGKCMRVEVELRGKQSENYNLHL